jgi:hypothetical protein
MSTVHNTHDIGTPTGDDVRCFLGGRDVHQGCNFYRTNGAPSATHPMYYPGPHRGSGAKPLGPGPFFEVSVRMTPPSIVGKRNLRTPGASSYAWTQGGRSGTPCMFLVWPGLMGSHSVWLAPEGCPADVGLDANGYGFLALNLDYVEQRLLANPDDTLVLWTPETGFC